jgi:hypothetical protein
MPDMVVKGKRSSALGAKRPHSPLTPQEVSAFIAGKSLELLALQRPNLNPLNLAQLA